MKNIVAIIQARVGSTRFKNKILKTLYEKTLLEHVVERVSYSKCVNNIVLATTLNQEDDELISIANSNQISSYRGSVDNVLERFYFTAQKYKADVIVRVTADDPFKDPTIMDIAIDYLINNNYDYVSNTIIPSYPEGIDIEVFSFEALQKAFLEAKLPSEKEHVTPYIWKNENLFKLKNFCHTEDLSDLRWTIDYEEDYLFARNIYERLYPQKKIFLMADILDLIKKDRLSIVKKKVVRNEGYKKSIEGEILCKE